MKATLPNGTVIDGTPADLAKLLEAINGQAVSVGKQVKAATKSAPAKSKGRRRSDNRGKSVDPENDRRGYVFLHGTRHPDVIKEEEFALNALNGLALGTTVLLAENMIASRAQALRENIGKRKFSFERLTLRPEDLVLFTRSAGRDEHGRQIVNLYAERPFSV